MSLTVQSGVPSILTAGDAVSFLVSDVNFPAPTWGSKVYFKDESNAVKSFDGVQSGSGHLFELTNANTVMLVSGQNLVCLIFSDGTNRSSTEWTSVLILPNPAIAEPLSFAQTQVNLLRKVIATFNSSGILEVNFSGQAFTRGNLNDYQTQLTNYEADVRQEKEQAKANRGLPTIGRRIPVSFV